PDFIYAKKNGAWSLEEKTPGPPPREDLALVLFTSGSTGATKAVRLSYDGLDANAHVIADYLRLDESERALLTLPAHYCYGLSVVNSHLARGASLVAGLHGLSEAGFLEKLDALAATSFAGVPYSFEILERIGFRAARLPALRYVTQAGGRLSPALVRTYAEWAIERGKEFYVMYGQTEATARMTYLCAADARRRPASIGKPVAGGAIDLVADDGAASGADGEGEIHFSGPNVMLGYAHGRADLSKPREISVLHTGDIARRDAEGFHYLIGRKARFAKLFGLRLNLDDVEAALAQDGVAAVALSDDARLFVVSENGLDSNLPRRLAERYGLPEARIACRRLETLPRLPSGKPDYDAILRLVKETDEPADRPRKRRRAPTVAETEKALLALFSEHFPEKTVTEQSSFLSLEGDSMSYVQISLGVEDVVGALPDKWETMTIHALAAAAPVRRDHIVWVESGVLLRVCAILFVVMNHAGLSFFRGGAALLLLMAGANFARFQWRQAVEGRFSVLAGHIAVNILAPYWLILIGYQAAKGALSWLDIGLVGNLIGHGGARQPFGVWFIEALVQSIVLMAAPAAVPAVRKFAARRPFDYALAFFGFALALRLIDGFGAYGARAGLGGEEISWVLWLFAAGAVIVFADTTPRRLIASAIVVISPPLFYAGDYSRILIAAAGAMVLIWAARLPAPRFSAGFLSLVAESSYFIYMLHPRAPVDSFTTDWPVDVVRIGLGLIFGVVGWRVYAFAKQTGFAAVKNALKKRR
ncbi:MAG: AMP-binding protein, partial [Parvularculaceae bacterium]